MDNLKDTLKDEIAQKPESDISPLVAHILSAARDSGTICAMLLYGSGLWQGYSEDTVWDMHVLVESYKGFNDKIWHRLAGSVIAPNVYYFEFPSGGKTWRCKCNVMRMDQFQKSARGQCLTPHIWARFAQPCYLAYARSQEDRERTLTALSHCVVTFQKFALPFCEAKEISSKDLWTAGFQKTYGMELRSERHNRIENLYEARSSQYETRTRTAVQDRLLSLTLVSPDRYRVNLSSTRIRWRRILHTVSLPFQKVAAIFRIIKSSTTFDGGVDYALWKVERHSGVRVEVTEFQRKYPLIGGWPVLWTLWRKGALK